MGSDNELYMIIGNYISYETDMFKIIINIRRE